MRILFSWFDFLLHGWFIKILDDYFEYMGSNKKVWHFYRNNLKTDKDIVWTNESRCETLDYELFYRQFDKIYYIIRKPITAMLNYYLWVDNPSDLSYFHTFVENHMIEYITHYKCHRKITKNIIKIEDIINNFDYFSTIMETVIFNVDKNVLYEMYSKNQALKIDIRKVQKKTKQYIIEIWKENGLEYEWEK